MRTYIFIIIAILISISFVSAADTGGFGVAILPKMSTISPESQQNYVIKIVSTENFDDHVTINLTTNGISSSYGIELSWFEWVNNTADIPAGGTVTIKNNISIPAGTPSGRMAFRVEIISKKNMTVYDTALITIESSSTLPPDPVTVAPPVDTTVATTIATATEFLYTGSDPIQTGVTPGTIEVRRAAVLRGRVFTREDNPLSGVNITILSHPEFGSTISRADGMFDMAVNGGGLLTVNYEKTGYLTAQRQVQAPWQDYEWLPDVVMIHADPQLTIINLSSSEPIQVAQGNIVNDSDGIRQATLLFPQDIKANITLPDGTTQPLTAMHVRATEYTVGENGPEAMPAQLPPTSGYTYAVDLTVDEAMAKGATDVRFDKPVYFYVENFLNFPVGGIVPVGYYNRSLGQWIPSENGKIIKILSITSGMVDLDVNGSNKTANSSQLAALNITDAERQQLAVLYQPRQTLWRVPIVHFTPWDCNWPVGPAGDAIVSNESAPDQNNPTSGCPTTVGGSIIGCEDQTLGEAIEIVGTPFSLHYQSDRVPGRKEAYTLKIPLSRASPVCQLTSQASILRCLWQGEASHTVSRQSKIRFKPSHGMERMPTVGFCRAHSQSLHA